MSQPIKPQPETIELPPATATGAGALNTSAARKTIRSTASSYTKSSIVCGLRTSVATSARSSLSPLALQ